MHTDRRLYGLGLVAVATALWSTAGLFVNLVDLDAWTILGWRSVFAVLALLVIVLINRRSRGPVAAPVPGRILWLAVPVATVSMGAYVVALTLTTVANVMVVYASVPLLTATLAWFVLGERITGRVVTASIAAMVGVAVMVGGAVQPGHILGVAVAFMMTIAMGTQIVLARMHPGLDMAVVNLFAAVACAVCGLLLGQTAIPSLFELGVLAVFGISNTAIAYYFLLLGARHVPSAEVGILSTLEVILGPLWVWLAFAEIPSRGAIFGGAIVLAAVVWYLLAEARSSSSRQK